MELLLDEPCGGPNRSAAPWPVRFTLRLARMILNRRLRASDWADRRREWVLAAGVSLRSTVEVDARVPGEPTSLFVDRISFSESQKRESAGSATGDGTTSPETSRGRGARAAFRRKDRGDFLLLPSALRPAGK